MKKFISFFDEKTGLVVSCDMDRGVFTASSEDCVLVESADVCEFVDIVSDILRAGGRSGEVVAGFVRKFETVIR